MAGLSKQRQRQHLAIADRHIAEGEARVAQQAEIVASWAPTGMT